MSKGRQKLLLLILMILVFMLSIATNALAANKEEGLTAYVREKDYEQYLSQYQGAARPKQETIILAAEYSAAEDVQVIENLGSYQGKILSTSETGYVEWKVNIAEEGLYNIKTKYYPVEGRTSSIEREILVNGERPFSGAQYLKFHRVWGDQSKTKKDSMGNEIRARQVEKPRWQESLFTDSLGYVQEPYKFYFKKGVNTIRLVSRKEPMGIAWLKIYQEKEPVPYEDVASEYQKHGYQPAQKVFIKLQGQDANYRSDPTLIPVSEQGDPTAEPYHPAPIRLNAIGGHRWAQAGQWISWEFDVPKDGLYQIAIKGKQDQKIGAYSNRKIMIDGELPFTELSAVLFPYSDHYQMKRLEYSEGEPYLFYLTKGKHELKMEVVLGNLNQILKRTEDSLYELNTIYRRIIMITSTTPDPMRSYQLDKRIPEVIERIRIQAETIKKLAEDFESFSGQTGGHTNTLNKFALLLARMAEDDEYIPRVLGEYRDNIGSLGTWIMQTKEQPLQIDYIIVASPEQRLPKAVPTFAQRALHEIRAFIASFTYRYDLVGEMSESQDGNIGREPLKVWIGGGRDQSQSLKQMIEDDFTPASGIPVQLQLVPTMGDLLIKATIAGTGPDVAMGLNTADPINFALRGAITDLAAFPDFPKVAQNFKKSAFVPFRFRDKVYALPQAQSFPMMFYRKDIMAELGLSIPETWDDIYRILPVLQKNNMSVGIGSGIYQTWLYQRGELMYKEDGVETNLDSEVAIQTFTEITELFTLYNLLITFNAENRFRMGEMPIVISDYGLYNRLVVFAPELREEWGFTLVPGTRMADGSINRTLASSPTGTAVKQMDMGGAAICIMEKAKDKDAGWEFLKWWTSADVQVRFARELESLMGAAARYPASNIEAFKQLPWTVEERKKLMTQWDYVEGTLEVPGSYYTGRMFDWAFRAVVLNYQPARETLSEYNLLINAELAAKREEFGLETDYQKLDEKWKRNFWQQFTHIKSPYEK